MYAREQIQEAFQKWNEGWQADPSSYRSTEECLAEAPDTLAAQQTNQLVEIMESTK